MLIALVMNWEWTKFKLLKKLKNFKPANYFKRLKINICVLFRRNAFNLPPKNAIFCKN